MSERASGTFDIVSWDELPYDEIGKAKLTRATVVQTFSGDIAGEGKVEYVMAYGEDGNATYVGVVRVTGKLGEREGSFVMRDVGTFADGGARSTWNIVPGAGTGDLANLRGSGEFSAHRSRTANYTLDYDWEPAAEE